MRQWYEACDERGLPAVTCVAQLHKMSTLLLEKVNFGQFPPPGNNVQGVPLSHMREFFNVIHFEYTCINMLNRACTTTGPYQHWQLKVSSQT